MKISNSKKQLAEIIHENGGWRDGAKWAAQDKQYCGRKNNVALYDSKPPRPEKGEECWGGFPGAMMCEFEAAELLPNWHQTILSREEYFHLYPEPDADGWIEWNGGDCPVDGDEFVVGKVRSGRVWRDGKAIRAKVLRWRHTGGIADIIAYRLHKPEQVKPELCESVMRQIPEPSDKPTIEQLAADYRNRKDYAERKQQEADAAKADAEAKLVKLVAAGMAHGLVLSVVAPEAELVITDWRDLKVGDEISVQHLKNVYSKSSVLVVGVREVGIRNHAGARKVVNLDEIDWRFIRRP